MGTAIKPHIPSEDAFAQEAAAEVPTRGRMRSLDRPRAGEGGRSRITFGVQMCAPLQAVPPLPSSRLNFLHIKTKKSETGGISQLTQDLRAKRSNGDGN